MKELLENLQRNKENGRETVETVETVEKISHNPNTLFLFSLHPCQQTPNRYYSLAAPPSRHPATGAPATQPPSHPPGPPPCVLRSLRPAIAPECAGWSGPHGVTWAMT